MKKTVAGLGVLAVAGLLGTGLSGCSAKVETSTSVSKQASVSADQLQKDLTDRLTKAGVTAKSVTCNDELLGEVGKTARCDVSFGDNNSLQALFTATKVDGSTVDFDITPAMNKQQVEKAVASISGAPSATCASGLDGKVGETTKCETTQDGTTTKRIAEVANVVPEKLGLELSVYTVLPKQKIEEVLLQKLSSAGKAVETVECVDDVVSKVGSTVECVSVTGNDKVGYDVVVTEAKGDNVNLDYKAKP